MSYRSRKNISAVLHDVKHPGKGPRSPKKSIKTEPPKTKKKFHTKPVLVGLVIGLLVGISGYGLYVSGVAGSVTNSVRSWTSDGVDVSHEDLAFSSESLFKLPSFFGNITDVISAAREISGGINDLNNRGLALVFSGTGGDEFINILKRIHGNLALLNDIGFDVGDQISSLITDDNGLNNLIADAQGLENGLGAIISFLDVGEDRRVILLFENHSEIRPSGGFVGSYGEVVLNKGSIRSIDVNDIYTPDRSVKYRIVPPKQLQSITIGWGARDANWFFDFPSSAEKFLELLEASPMYVNDDAKFDGAIALNANVVSDVLKIVGPIYVPEHDVTLTSDNFLLAIREEVEEARDENPKENPKQILELITPTILERVQSLDQDSKRELLLSLMVRALNKDLKFYFRDGELQEFIEDTPFAGKVYELPDVFNGDYLAVVNANVAGGKTDIFIDQDITLNSTITSRGSVQNELIVERRHFGQNEEQELYRSTNQNFIKIFTPLGTSLNSESGADDKRIEPRINYKEEGYSFDPDLQELESTFVDIASSKVDRYLESGKNVFAGWIITPAGETRTLRISYSGGELFIGQGAKYQFVFDKQSGVESSLKYTVAAPNGYMWRESGEKEYSYESDSIPNRLVLNLTLVKDGPRSEN